MKMFSFYLLDRVLYARKGGEDGAVATTNLGGEKISVEDACVSDMVNPPEPKNNIYRA